MNLFPSLRKRYTKDRLSAIEAQRAAQEIAFGPVVFQVSRLMIKWGIFELLSEHKDGLNAEAIASKKKLSLYAVHVLLESSLSIGSVLLQNDRFVLSKIGWFLLNDEMVRINMNFNHDVNYKGMFRLEESLLNGKPEGLNVFGEWNTIYEGLSQLPSEVQQSWFAFDHYYSDHSFDKALEIVFKNNPVSILDVGGNTGRWALKCVEYNKKAEVTVMDLPGQLETMQKQIAGRAEADRIHIFSGNVLDEKTVFPGGFDVVWMSQFLDCFSEGEIISILSRIFEAVGSNSVLYVMETFWDRQKYETAAYCLTQISPYFTALANGNSKMYHSDRMINCIKTAGFVITEIYDDLGLGHSLLECRIS